MKRLILPFALALAVACDEPAHDAPAAAPAAAAARGPRARPKKVDCPPSTESVVAPSDEALEAEIRRGLGKGAGALTAQDLARVESLHLTSGPPIDLDPCIFPRMTNLKELYLAPRGELDDLSPLAGLARLETLRIPASKVSDLRPLEKLAKLDRLDLARTLVHDLAPLARLDALTELVLDDTAVESVGPLETCTKLRRLSIKRTRVRDVTPLLNLAELRFLYVDGAPIDSTRALDALVAGGLKIVR
jgi:internalin A